MLTRRILFATAATVALLGSLTLVASAQAEPTIFTMAYTTTFPDIDPSTSFSNDSAVTSNVYETLVKYQVGADGAGKLVPSLAEKWESSDGGKQWTFHLDRKSVV